MINQIKELMQNEEGAESLEYVGIVAIVIVIGVAAYTPGLSALISTAFSTLASVIPN